MQVPSKLGTTLIYGRIGEGKSLLTASFAYKLMKSYKKMEKKYPQLPKRKLWSNIVFSDKFYEENKERIVYWENVRQLIDVRDSDILYDEIANDFPADGFRDVNKKIRKIFSHCRKRGNRIFANTQDFRGVDINIRRMCKLAFKVRKWFGNRDVTATMPNPKYIWGSLIIRQFMPDQIENEKDDAKLEVMGIPHYMFIRRKYISIYDTTKELEPYFPDTFEHSVLKCEHVRGLEEEMGRELSEQELEVMKKTHSSGCFFIRVEHKKI